MAPQRARHRPRACSAARRRHRRLDRDLRRLIAFACAGETLIGSLDEAPGRTGLLIVSGGNEIRAGAHRGMALLAACLAADGVPVFRYDRRGVGDSSGENGGFETSRDDIAAAIAAFRAEAPRVDRLIGFGNCDAAAALVLFGAAAGLDGLILANPWTIEDGDGLPPAAAIRARYVERLRDPASYLRLLRGGIDIGKLVKGLLKLSKTRSEPATSLATRLREALSAMTIPVDVVLAKGDATAIAFAAAIGDADLPARLHPIDTASHSFARAADKIALEAVIRAALGSGG